MLLGMLVFASLKIIPAKLKTQRTLDSSTDSPLQKIPSGNKKRESKRVPSFSKFSKSATNYDISELTTINQKLLQSLDFIAVSKRLKEIGISEEISEKFWNSLKLNIIFLHELKEWIAICNHEFHFENKESDKEFLREAASLLPKDTADENCWNLWLNEIKKKTDRKGKDLFMPIRLALSGKEHGPELKFLVNLIERKEILNRLAI
jgi:glutamyl-tRNA synthetase